MNTFFVIDALTDNEAYYVVKRRCDASINAVLQVDKETPEGEDNIGLITRQYVSGTHLSYKWYIANSA